MLKLKRVEIQGFKSFYDRTEMKFQGSGIAAIVGPNGCGKSNLSDAISWVLGEQSAKSLRGTRMEDVIFAGTREKKPLGMASVMMTLVPDETQRAIESTGEVTITRRLYRSGESEYLVNGKVARLRDIQDLFLGTGLGPESYAIIEQGRIGQILSNKPQDRRSVIEEAAGITKFKTRKRLAEAKLESAKQNLSRVFDILEEVTRQVNSLKRQAAKTKRYTELKTEATQHLRLLLGARFRLLERETAKIAIELNLAGAEVQELQTAIGGREGIHASVLESSYATEQDLTEARKLLADLHLETERARSQIEYQAKQIEQIAERLRAGELEAQTLERQQAERASELGEQNAELDLLAGECATARQALEVKTAERQQAQNKLGGQEQSLEAARARVMRLLSESSTLKNRITHTEAQLASSDREAGRARTEEQQANNDLGQVQQARAQLSERLAARQTELISVADQRKDVERELGERRAQLQQTRQTVDSLRSEYSRIKARKDSLEEVLAHRSYTTETVKQLFTAVERGKAQNLHPVGVLADFLEVEPQLEKATEEFLHDELEYVVVRDWAQAEHGVELMRSDLDGRATFLVEAAEKQGTALEIMHPPPEGDKLSRLTDALRLTNGLSNLPVQLLPRIANCYIAVDRELARELAEQFPHCWFLTPDGINYHGHAVTGGRKKGAGPLALKRELRDIAKLEQVKGNTLNSEQAKLGELERVIAGLSEDLERLRAQQQAQEKDVLALDHESRKLAEELQRVQSRLSRARLELERLSQEQVQLHENVDRDRNSLEQIEKARGDEERVLESAREALTELQIEAARLSEEHATLRASLASLEERQRSLAASRARLESQIQDLNRRREHLGREMERLHTERERFLASNRELESRTGELRGSIADAENAVTTLDAKETDLRSQLAATEEELKTLRAKALAAGDRRSELQVTLARSESDLAHLEETCQKELETTLAQLVEGSETIPDEASMAEIDAKYAEVRRKIEALGPVNPQALEEYEEASQRQEFLSAQRQDLLDSIRDTERAIQDIDAESRKRFGEAFHAINANFGEMFQVLFGGGTGEMRLTDEENLAESGIDLVASPPGKKLQSVLLLSGGEKSLTAMALLMAIFQYTPSPFCILDEVDAPLDEPNIERLTRLLQEMAGQTQFIVITHAKRTMEAAQALYGVTMQEPGVSKLVSVKFDGPGQARNGTGTHVARERLEAVVTA